MLLTISTTHRPATDLGYLLHKNPARAQIFPLNFGQAHVYYPEATAERCTAALLLEVDPVGLVRRGGGHRGFALDQYVNDRPYVASSFMSVAMSDVYGSALSGASRERSALAEQPIALTARLAVVRCRGGEATLRRLFLPLGYTTVEAVRHQLDTTFPEWGASQYYTVELAATTRLQDLLRQLTVLIPVLDDDKHYWVGEDELEKLLRRGKGWLETHPERELIAERYLKHRRGLVREAMTRLVVENESDLSDPDEVAAEHDREETDIERRVGLHEQRLESVAQIMVESGARRVLDLGCGEGKLIRKLLPERQFQEIVGVDVASQVLAHAARRFRLDQPPAKGRVALLQGAVTYRDQRLAGFDAAAIVEVIEHLDPHRLAAFERVVFEFARPGLVILTTPNVEYNALFPNLPAGRMRHRDHRFEWTRAEFLAWARAVVAKFGYEVQFMAVGDEDAVHGPPSQVAVFSRGGR